MSKSEDAVIPSIACSPDGESLTLWQLLFSFKGRINRKTFWVSIILSWIMIALCYATFFYFPTILTILENIDKVFGIPLGNISNIDSVNLLLYSNGYYSKTIT